MYLASVPIAPARVGPLQRFSLRVDKQVLWFLLKTSEILDSDLIFGNDLDANKSYLRPSLSLLALTSPIAPTTRQELPAHSGSG